MTVAENHRPGLAQMIRTDKQFDAIADPDLTSGVGVHHGCGIGHIEQHVEVLIIPAEFETGFNTTGVAAVDESAGGNLLCGCAGESRSSAVHFHG